MKPTLYWSQIAEIEKAKKLLEEKCLKQDV